MVGVSAFRLSGRLYCCVRIEDDGGIVMRSPLQQLIERCRRQQQQIPGQLEMLSEREEQLMGVYQAQSDFMTTLKAATSEITWASERETLEEWRSRTLEDWGFGRWFDEDVPAV